MGPPAPSLSSPSVGFAPPPPPARDLWSTGVSRPRGACPRSTRQQQWSGLSLGLIPDTVLRSSTCTLPPSDAYPLQIRAQVQAHLGVTVSAGVAPNKLLAKLASAAAKPDAVRLVRDAQALLAATPASRLPGLGGRAVDLQSRKAADLQPLSVGELAQVLALSPAQVTSLAPRTWQGSGGRGGSTNTRTCPPPPHTRKYLNGRAPRVDAPPPPPQPDTPTPRPK